MARCPRCRQGSVFPSTLKGWLGFMHERCSVCGLAFLRETGYFLGAMYISYALGVLTILPVAIVLAVVLEWDLWLVLLIAILQTIISMPIFFRYSRLIWLHVDQAIDPR
ncbi:MAG TPA: DUF983 domain-containing protein [Dehalococcoidia bacterium]|jgi:uncharacterized protein (DUF983 family)|nr:DUF983 domain-containing protein [Dehalococcoidia bacterium]